MESKTFKIVTSISMVLALTVAVLSLIAIFITGIYPGIFVLLILATIPIASRYFATKISGRSNNFKVNFYASVTVINMLSILIVLWMTFVIVHDRVLGDCC